MNIEQFISGHTFDLPIEVVQETGSTNADLLARAATLSGPTVLIAERQTAGRGRAGRTWHAAPGATLTFSIAWPFFRPLAQLLGLPLAVGVALAEALNELGVPVTLKWPNDILKAGSKLAGILVETAAASPAQAPAANWAIVGIGLNLAMPDALEEAIGRPVAAAPWLAQMPREQMMAVSLKHLAAALDQFDAAGFAPFQARWNALHAYRNQPVELSEHGKLLQRGIARGVDERGQLLLDTPAGLLAVMAGDVSLRPSEVAS